MVKLMHWQSTKVTYKDGKLRFNGKPTHHTSCAFPTCNFCFKWNRNPLLRDAGNFPDHTICFNEIHGIHGMVYRGTAPSKDVSHAQVHHQQWYNHNKLRHCICC